MNGASPSTATNDSLKVSLWVRVILYSVCAIPLALSAWALIRQLAYPFGNDSIVSSIACSAVFASFGWLLTRIHSLSSIELSSHGLAQSLTSLNRGFGVHIYVPWDQVDRVSFSGMSYRFCTLEGLTFELNIALFGDANVAIAAVRSLIPPRLLSGLPPAPTTTT